jgi:hypothetical protein
MRDSHAKCVRIYRRTGSRLVLSCGFRPNPAMAPTLLMRWKGSGRNQPFTPGTMKRTQVAAVKLCPDLVVRGRLHCTEPRPLPVASWQIISFCPVIRFDLNPEPPAGVLLRRAARRDVAPRRPHVQGRDEGSTMTRRALRARPKVCRRKNAWFCRQSRTNKLVCLPHTRSATRNFLGLRSKKHLVRNRRKVL